MCIALISTSHPAYALILISNRDEYLSRPTTPAAFWPSPHSHVLAGRDGLRAVHGTWLGATRDGRIAVLTNFREADADAALGRTSRGEMVMAYLCPPAAHVPQPREFVQQLVRGDGARGSGGFSLVCGKVGGELAVVSNRMKSEEEVKIVKTVGDTVALSNAAFGDRTWKKVTKGEDLLRELVDRAASEKWTRDELVEKLFRLLDTDDMPPAGPEVSQAERMTQLRDSIFVPVLGERNQEPEKGNDAEKTLAKLALTGAYGTQQQTVILVDHHQNITYVERTLLDRSAGEEEPRTRRFDFRMDDAAH